MIFEGEKLDAPAVWQVIPPSEPLVGEGWLGASSRSVTASARLVPPLTS